MEVVGLERGLVMGRYGHDPLFVICGVIYLVYVFLLCLLGPILVASGRVWLGADWVAALGTYAGGFARHLEELGYGVCMG